jgi:hypothetical protein
MHMAKNHLKSHCLSVFIEASLYTQLGYEELSPFLAPLSSIEVMGWGKTF